LALKQKNEMKKKFSFGGTGLVLVLGLLTGSTTAVPVNNEEEMFAEIDAQKNHKF